MILHSNWMVWETRVVQRSGWVSAVMRRTYLSVCQLKPLNRDSLKSRRDNSLVQLDGKIYTLF